MIRLKLYHPRSSTRALMLMLTLATAACGPGDALVRDRVDSTLAADDSVGIWRFVVDNREGTITLSATVPTQSVRQRAVRLAAATPGVTDVIDRIVVQTPANSPDSASNGTNRRRSMHRDGM